jgi:hypothetical protein
LTDAETLHESILLCFGLLNLDLACEISLILSSLLILHELLKRMFLLLLGFEVLEQGPLTAQLIKFIFDFSSFFCWQHEIVLAWLMQRLRDLTTHLRLHKAALRRLFKVIDFLFV